jgi:hypothetical protein
MRLHLIVPILTGILSGCGHLGSDQVVTISNATYTGIRPAGVPGKVIEMSSGRITSVPQRAINVQSPQEAKSGFVLAAFKSPKSNLVWIGGCEDFYIETKDEILGVSRFHDLIIEIDRSLLRGVHSGTIDSVLAENRGTLAYDALNSYARHPPKGQQGCLRFAADFRLRILWPLWQ